MLENQVLVWFKASEASYFLAVSKKSKNTLNLVNSDFKSVAGQLSSESLLINHATFQVVN